MSAEQNPGRVRRDPLNAAWRTERRVVLSVGHYLVLIAFAFLAGMLLAALIIGTLAGKVGL